jgi:hypothetical protein
MSELLLMTGGALLAERLQTPQQVAPTDEAADLPPYMESFLAHLRLLVGVPFEYLIPDARLLPDESLRFFYLDRSWTDRLVDGALAVGQIGSREHAHHQAQHTPVKQRLDVSEHYVRPLQRGKMDFATAQDTFKDKTGDTITGLIIRSAAVSGWPHMDIRAFGKTVKRGTYDDDATKDQLPTLRIERLSPAVIIALFQGVPELVWLEEPHHCMQFGVYRASNGTLHLKRHATAGDIELGGTPLPAVPVRQANPRVLAIANLRDMLYSHTDAQMPPQTGSASFAIELLKLPWRQRFGGLGDGGTSGGFNAAIEVTARASETLSPQIMQEVIRP